MKKNVLAFVGDVYEDLELWYPKLRLEEAGYITRLAGEEMRGFTGKHGYPASADSESGVRAGGHCVFRSRGLQSHGPGFPLN